jgi:hypothetical protein
LGSYIKERYKLRAFRNRVLRKIFGTLRKEGKRKLEKTA